MTEPTASTPTASTATASTPTSRSDGEFRSFVAAAEAPLRRALVARFGIEVGCEVTAEALAVAWEQWPRLRRMERPVGYLFRVGQSKARPHLRWRARAARQDLAPGAVDTVPPDVLDLLACLRRLRPDQRTALVLVKSYGYSHAEVAEILDVSTSVVNNLVHRALQRVRVLMEVSE